MSYFLLLAVMLLVKQHEYNNIQPDERLSPLRMNYHTGKQWGSSLLFKTKSRSMRLVLLFVYL